MQNSIDRRTLSILTYKRWTRSSIHTQFRNNKHQIHIHLSRSALNYAEIGMSKRHNSREFTCPKCSCWPTPMNRYRPIRRRTVQEQLRYKGMDLPKRRGSHLVRGSAYFELTLQMPLEQNRCHRRRRRGGGARLSRKDSRIQPQTDSGSRPSAPNSDGK